MDWIYIQKSSIEWATKNAKRDGKRDAKIEMMINAHQIGLPMQTISELTGFDEDAIVEILKKQT